MSHMVNRCVHLCRVHDTIQIQETLLDSRVYINHRQYERGVAFMTSLGGTGSEGLSAGLLLFALVVLQSSPDGILCQH